MSKTRRSATHGRAYVTNLGAIAVYGEPGECHNCDEMGCPSTSHIVAWGRVNKWDHDEHQPDNDGDCARCGASAELYGQLEPHPTETCPLDCYRGLDLTTDGAEIYVVFCEACYPLMYKYWAERQLMSGEEHVRDE